MVVGRGNDAIPTCDRIIFLKDGKVKEDLKRTGDKEQFYNEIITNWC